MDTVTDSSPNRGDGAQSRITRIVVGVDGFAEGQDAAALGKALSDATGAQLVLVLVNPEPLILPPSGVSWSEQREEAREVLRRARATVAASAQTVIETDFSVPRALHRVVDRGQGDLLVMGSSRKVPEGKVRIGSRTRQLLCSLQSPLAVAPRGYSHRDRREFGRIGVGYDGGPEAAAALQLAASVAQGADAELDVLDVVDDRPPPIGWTHFGAGGAAHAQWEKAVLAEVERRQGESDAALRACGASGRVEVKRGRPAGALLDLSESVDLLLIGSRRWGAMKRLLVGSTGEALLHDAACPVLVVPRPAE